MVSKLKGDIANASPALIRVKWNVTLCIQGSLGVCITYQNIYFKKKLRTMFDRNPMFSLGYSPELVHSHSRWCFNIVQQFPRLYTHIHVFLCIYMLAAIPLTMSAGLLFGSFIGTIIVCISGTVSQFLLQVRKIKMTIST